MPHAATKRTKASAAGITSDGGSEAGAAALAWQARHATKSMNPASPTAKAAAAHGPTARSWPPRGADHEPRAGTAGLRGARKDRSQKRIAAGSAPPKANITVRKATRDMRPSAAPEAEKWLAAVSGSAEPAQQARAAPAAIAASAAARGMRSRGLSM